MNQGYNSIMLFTPPRLAEERKVYWPGMQAFTQPAVASSFDGVSRNFGGLGVLGDWFTEGIKAIHANVQDGFDTITGVKQQREAQANAVALQQIRAQQAAFEASQRAQGWGSAAPWLAVGGALVVVAVAMAAKKS